MSYAKRPLPIGKKFGLLRLLREVPTTEKCRRYVYCSCDCGSRKVIRYDGVQSGRVKSCGCSISEKSKRQIEQMVVTRRRNKERVVQSEYIGKRFNNLVVESIYHHPKYKGTWFHLRCDCGNKTIASLAKLKINHVRSCGCYHATRKPFVEFVSEIDGEIMRVSGKTGRYQQLLKHNAAKSKEFVHVHEAQKAFIISGKVWDANMCVHHVDCDGRNNQSDNLCVFPDGGSHRAYHEHLSAAMYSFLKSKELLVEFYEQYPHLRPETLKDILLSSKSETEMQAELPKNIV